MSRDLEQLRQQAADAARARFDFGEPLMEANRWQDDGRDALTCRVRLTSRGEPRRLTVRVSFAPGTDQLDHIDVAERLAAI